MKTRFEFLKSLYLPGYMGLQTEDYNGRGATFDFMPTEPPVAAIPIGYVTPRGAHIFISQAGLCLVENVIQTEGFDMSAEDFRQLTMEGRMKIVELNQKYRREVETNRNLQGRMDLTKIRWGKMPMIKIDFDIDLTLFIEFK